MKTLSVLFLSLCSVCLFAAGPPPPVVRNFWDTNANAQVLVQAGSNCTVTASTIGVDERIFTVDVPASGGPSIGVAASANVGIFTNGTVVTPFLTGTLTNNTSGNAATASISTTNSGPLSAKQIPGVVTNNETFVTFGEALLLTGSAPALGLTNSFGEVDLGLISGPNLSVNAGVTATSFSGSGAALTGLNASQLTSGRFAPPVQALSIVGTNVTVDFSLGNHFSLTLTTNVFFAYPANMAAMQEAVIDIRQDATGVRSVTFTNAWRFPSGQILTTTTNANAWSILSCIVGQNATNVACVQTLNFQ